MKKALSISVVLLATFSMLSMVTVYNAGSETSMYRRMITICNYGNPENLTDYQIFINVTYDPDMQPDFDDLRFTWYNETSGEEVNIDYWLDKYVDSEYALVWVEIPYIRELGQETLYMYYGDPDAVSGSNGEETFVFFDDFSTNTTANYEIIRHESKPEIIWYPNGWLFLNASFRIRSDHCSNVYVRHKTALIDATQEKYCLETRSKANGTGILDYFGVTQLYKYDSIPKYYYSLQCLVRHTTEIQSIWGSITGWEFRRFGSVPTVKDKWYRFGVGTNSTGAVYGEFYDDDYDEVETLIDQTIHQNNKWWVGFQGSNGGDPGGDPEKYTTLYVFLDYIRVRKFTDPEPSYSIGEEETLFLPATVDIDPDTLNLRSKGKWITAYIELPEGYDVNDMNVTTIMLNDTISAELHPIEVGDYDSDGIPDLMVKFDRSEVISYILDNVEVCGGEKSFTVSLTVTGTLHDGTVFQGSDTIRILVPHPKGKVFDY